MCVEDATAALTRASTQEARIVAAQTGGLRLSAASPGARVVNAVRVPSFRRVQDVSLYCYWTRPLALRKPVPCDCAGGVQFSRTSGRLFSRTRGPPATCIYIYPHIPETRMSQRAVRALLPVIITAVQYCSPRRHAQLGGPTVRRIKTNQESTPEFVTEKSKGKEISRSRHQRRERA